MTMTMTMIFDIFYVILNEYISPIELIRLRCLNVDMKEVIDKILKRKMEMYKKKLGCPMDLFSYLNKDAVLSGSCMVQYLLNEYYDNHDIDIFVNKERLEKISSYLIENKYECDKNLEFDARYPSRFKVYNFYKDSCTKIQLIKCEDVKANILNFDFNIVKNYYDGKSIIIKDIIHLSKKIEIFDNSQCQYGRIVKYIHRGFFIIPNDFSLLKEYIKCLQKYKYDTENMKNCIIKLEKILGRWGG